MITGDDQKTDPSAAAGGHGELAGLVAAWNERDEKRFFSIVEAMATRPRQDLLHDVAELTRDIESALEHFCSNARLERLTNKEVPDARVSLEHVLDLTNEAAHRTMDLVERSYVPAERTRDLADRITPLWQAQRGTVVGNAELLSLFDEFLSSARSDAEEIRRNLSEVLLAQGYQDLSGQIIRGVIELIDEIHHALGGMVALSRGQSVEYRRNAEPDASGAMGPRIPGVSRGDVVNGQDEIDQLLSGIGQ